MTTLQFTADIPKEEFDNLENHIKSKLEIYCITKYIIGQESQPKEHYHFIIHYEVEEDLANKFQTNLVKTIVDKYNLRSSGKGGKRKYMDGNKQRIIKDFDNCVSYITKENNYRYLGYEKEYVEYRQSQSFIKNDEDKLDYQKLLKAKVLELFDSQENHSAFIDHCEAWHKPTYDQQSKSFIGFNNNVYNSEVNYIQEFVFNYLIDQKKDIKSFTQVKALTRYIIQYSNNNYIKNFRFQLFKQNN